MRRMYSEEQVKKIAATAVISALAEIGVEPNEYNGIDVDGLLQSGNIIVDTLVVGGSTASIGDYGDAYITGNVRVVGDTELSWDNKEAMGNFHVSSSAVRIGGVMEGTFASFSESGIRFNVDPMSQCIVLSGIPSVDPEIPGAIWVDEQTMTLKISQLK